MIHGLLVQNRLKRGVGNSAVSEKKTKEIQQQLVHCTRNLLPDLLQCDDRKSLHFIMIPFYISFWRLSRLHLLMHVHLLCLLECPC